MRSNLTKPLSYFILGLPRSGTTIVASFFNSLEDGLCLCEPHWYYANQGCTPKEIVENCVSPHKDYLTYNNNNMHDGFSIMSDLILRNRELYNLVGYKETWKGDTFGRVLLTVHLLEADFFIIVLRDPIECYQSQLRLNWPISEWTLERAIADTEFLRGLAYHPKARLIMFEAFREMPLEVVNREMNGFFQVEGPVDLQPTGWVYGDPKANQSTRVETNDKTC
jgi:hypothetical protein